VVIFLRFIVEARKICEEKGFRGFDIPVFVRWCEKHRRYEWCDPFNEVGGVAPDKETLHKSLIDHFICPNCNSFHVYYVWIEGRVVDFCEFLSSLVEKAD